MRYALAILVAAFALGLSDGRADQSDPRLKELFESLRNAPSPEAAADVESRIWEIWAKSGDASLDQVFQVGSHAMAVGDTNTALKIFDAIVQKAPNFAEGWNKRATAYYMMGELDRSLADCEEVVKRNPVHFGALSGFGLIYLQKEDLPKAAEYFEKALAVDPTLVQVQNVLERIREVLRQRRQQSI